MQTMALQKEGQEVEPMFKTEPAFMMGLIQAVLMAALTLLLAFGVTVTTDQVTAIMGAASVVLALVLSLYTRSQVTPTGKL
jgi:4-hydroxybenzoate polyprenyltransferase